MPWHAQSFPFIYGDFPASPAVYVVYLDTTPVYVGQTTNIANRFCGSRFRHSYGPTIITPWGMVPKSVKILVKYHHGRRFGDWAMREIRLINRLRPVYNTHYAGKGKRRGR